MLVDAGFVCEGVGADDRLVARRRGIGDLRQRAARGHDLGRVDVSGDAVSVGARAQRHYCILERAIARAFADAVHRAFDLARAGANRSKRIGYRHTQVVVAMDGEDHVRPVADVLDQEAEEVVNLLRRGVSDGVGHVERRRSGFHGGRQRLQCAVHVSQRGVGDAQIAVGRVRAAFRD